MTTLKVLAVGGAALVTGVPLTVATVALHGPAAGLLVGVAFGKLTEFAVWMSLRNT